MQKQYNCGRTTNNPEISRGGTERIAYLTFIMWFPQGSYTNVTDPSGCCISKQNPY